MAETSTGRETSAPRRGPSRVWAVAAVLIVIVVVGGLLIYAAGGRIAGFFEKVSTIPQNVAKGLADAFRPNIDYRTEITSAIRELKNKPKLVVLTATIDAEVKSSSSTTALWVYWGTTTVKMRAMENKVQFYVPLDDFSESNFTYDEIHKTLTVRTRQPVLDEDVVDVQTNPDKIEEETSNGWAKLDHWSGAPMRDDARRELRRAVISAAKQPAQLDLLQLKAQANAREDVKKLLSPMINTLKPEVKVEVEFQP